MTTTYATTRIVIDAVGQTIWAEDLGHDTYGGLTNPFKERAATFIDIAHVRMFDRWIHFTTWLVDNGIVVAECAILGAELSDGEWAHNLKPAT